MKKTKLSQRKKIILTISCVILAVLLAATLFSVNNPRVRLFLSVINFAEKTLNDPAYFLYDIDIMELFRDYGNSDTAIQGKLGLSKMKKLKSSVYMNVDAKRSFSQKRMASNSTIDILWLEAGNLDLYAEKDTVYFVVPILGDFGYAFPTGLNLFLKMPELTSDINREWFHDNLTNIITFMGEISIEETGEFLPDADGNPCAEFVITIPEGSGMFIWDLLGMDYPTYDVVVSMFLTSDNYMRQMKIDLSDVMPGATVVIDGEKADTMILTYELPENEKVEMTLVRNPDHTNYIDALTTYYTNVNTQYSVTSVINWEKIENGFSLYLKDMKIFCDKEQLAQGYFKGSVMKLNKEPDVFQGMDEYLYGLEALDWRKVRDDTETFINDVLDNIKSSVF